MVNVKNLSSGYHYISATLEKLKNLQQLYLVGHSKNVTHYPKKAARAIYKGLNNLAEGKNFKLELLNFVRVYFSGTQSEITECLFTPLNKYLANIKSLRINETTLLSV